MRFSRFQGQRVKINAKHKQNMSGIPDKSRICVCILQFLIKYRIAGYNNVKANIVSSESHNFDATPPPKD